MRSFEDDFRKWVTEFIDTNGMPELKYTNALVEQLNTLKNCEDCTPDCREAQEQTGASSSAGAQ